MKMKYMWDEFDGLADLDTIHSVQFADGQVELVESPCDLELLLTAYGVEAVCERIVSYCVAIPDNSGEDL